MSAAAAIVGVGMTPFGRHPESLKNLAAPAIEAAVTDSGFNPADIDMAFVANAMSAVTTGQVSVVGQNVLRAAGFSSIPVFNIDNACAGSSSALNLAVQAIRAGTAERVLVLGVEKLYADDRSAAASALNGAADEDVVAASGIDVDRQSVFVASIYPQRLAAYAQRYSLSGSTLARIAVKNRGHATLNPMAQYRTPLTVDEVLAARSVVEPVTTLMCAPIGDGAAAVVVTRADLAEGRRPVWVRATEVGMGAPPGSESTIARVAGRAYRAAGLTPADVDVAEVHDSIAFNELLAYEELGLCEPGKGAVLVEEGVTSLGGRLPVNPSGGLGPAGTRWPPPGWRS